MPEEATMINDPQDPSPTIAEMAQQRPGSGYTPTAGEQGMLNQFNQRQADLDRIANAGGGVGILADPADADNAEKSARWAAEDQANKLKYPAGVGPSVPGASLAPRLAAPPPTAASPEQAAIAQSRQQRRAEKLAYADGGKPETAEQLLARISGKYGVSNSSTPTPQPQAAPAPAPTPQAAAPGSMIQQATGLLRGRAAQIDRAVNGYVQGGKIRGPGTATSDSIAGVTGTGRPIRVANGERIVSVAQDKALQRIAEMLGYDSVDAMFEKLTGKPVGPTIKGGKAAAANGLPPGTVDDGAGGVYTPEPGFNPGQAVVNLFKDSAQAARSGVDYNQVRQNRIQQESAPPVPLGNEGSSVPVAVTNTSQHPLSVPASRAAGAAILGAVNTDLPPDLTTKDIVPGGYLDRGDGIVAQRNGKGQLNVTNVGTGDLTDPTRRAVDDSASALIDQKGSTYNPQAQLARMQASRLMTDATDNTITDPAVRENAQKGLAILVAAQQGTAKAGLEAAQGDLAKQQAASANQLMALHQEYLNPATTPQRRDELHSIIRTLSGKEREPTNLQVTEVEEPLDPKQPLLGNKKIPYVFDPRSGQSRPMLQPSQSQDATAQAKAAIARGANKAAVNARLKQLGLPEVQ
jgi:hypothetical protein